MSMSVTICGLTGWLSMFTMVVMIAYVIFHSVHNI